MTISAAVGLTAHYGADRLSKTVVLRDSAHPVTYVSSWPFDLTITPSLPRQSVTLCTPQR